MSKSLEEFIVKEGLAEVFLSGHLSLESVIEIMEILDVNV